MTRTISQKVKLGDVADVIDSLHQTPGYSSIGYPMVRVTDIKPGYLKIETCLKVCEEVYLQFSNKHKPGPGDIVFSRVGSEGITSLVKSGQSFCLGQNTAFIIPRNKNNYLYYWLNSPLGKHEIITKTTGASQRTISLESIKGLELELLPLSMQNTTSSILTTYDDLIENNENRIKVLEEMAQLLYTRWFVNFKFPSHEKVKMIGSGTKFGTIPEGWEVKRLEDIADVKWGDTSTTKQAYVFDGYDAYSASGLDGKLDHFDYTQDGIVLSAIGANCGLTWLAKGKWSCIKNTIRILEKDSDVNIEYLFLLTSRPNYWRRRGAAQPFLSQTEANMYPVLKPITSILKCFNALIKPLYNEIYYLNKANENLRFTRDLLISQLVTGKREIK